MILGGAALTRTYVERDLRQLYEGRLFYGKDAFEGLRIMDRLVELTQRRGRPRVRPRARGAEPAAPQERAAQAAADPADAARPARPRWPPTTPSSRRRSSGSRVAKGIALDDIAAYLNETALFRNQWGFRPERRARTTPTSRSGCGAVLRDAAGQGQGRASCSSPRWRGATSPPTPRATTWCSGGRDPARGAHAVPLPPPDEAPVAVHRRLLPAGRLGRARLGRLPVVTMGRRVSEEAAVLKADDQYTDYLYLHGLGVEMAEALAEYWHRRIREELGLRRRGRPHPDRLFRQQYRGGRYSWGYPACPDLEDNAKVVDLLGRRPHRRGR